MNEKPWRHNVLKTALELDERLSQNGGSVKWMDVSDYISLRKEEDKDFEGAIRECEQIIIVFASWKGRRTRSLDLFLARYQDALQAQKVQFVMLSPSGSFQNRAEQEVMDWHRFPLDESGKAFDKNWDLTDGEFGIHLDNLVHQVLPASA